MNLKKMFWVLFVMIILFLTFVQLTSSYYAEKFKLKGVVVRQFQFEDNKNQCKKIINYKNLDIGKPVYLALDFDIEYVDTEFQFFWQLDHSYSCKYGHIDSILNIEINTIKNPHEKIKLEKASIFWANGNFDWNGHVPNKNNCFIMNSYDDIEEFRGIYNSSLDSLGYIFNFEAPHLFLIKSSKEYFGKKITLNIKTNHNIIRDTFYLGVNPPSPY